MRKKIVSFLFVLFCFTIWVGPLAADKPAFQDETVSKRVMSLNKRYKNEFVSEVMKKNILLTLAYMQHKITDSKHIYWQNVEKPFRFSILLHPGDVYAFHSTILPEYKTKHVTSVDLTFTSEEGFLSDGDLVGDGVCHLASLIQYAAVDSGLSSLAPTNHDFAAIPEVPKAFGVSIFNYPPHVASNAYHNLYITNTKKNDIRITFEYDGSDLGVSFVERKPM